MVVVVHFGENTLLLKCLKSLTDIIEPSHVVVSNNNPLSLKPELRRDFPAVHVVDNASNLGYAGGINSGITFALTKNPSHVLIITEDTTYKKDFLNNILAYGNANHLDIVGPTVLDQDNNVWYGGGEIDPVRYSAGHKKGKTDYVPGCCVLVKKEVFEKIGILDDRYFIYYEDADFDLRAMHAGFRIGVCPDAIAYHDTYHTPQAYKNMDYYLARNHLLFLWKHAPWYIKFRELARLPKTFYEHFMKKEYDAIEGIRDFFLEKYGKR